MYRDVQQLTEAAGGLVASSPAPVEAVRARSARAPVYCMLPLLRARLSQQNALPLRRGVMRILRLNMKRCMHSVLLRSAPAPFVACFLCWVLDPCKT